MVSPVPEGAEYLLRLDGRLSIPLRGDLVFVARGDVNWIRIGERTNVQDGAILHVTHQRFPLEIGSEVAIAHGAIVHGCTLEDGSLIGIGATVLDGAVIERGAQVAAGAVVVPGQRIPTGHLAMGVPARVVRPLTPEQLEANREISRRYVRLKNEYLEILAGRTASGNGA